MNIFTTMKKKPNYLDREIEGILQEMQKYDKTSKEYAALVSQLDRLEKMKAEKAKARIKPDTLATIGANLGGIVLILKHEQIAAITSKALGFVIKGRL